MLYITILRVLAVLEFLRESILCRLKRSTRTGHKLRNQKATMESTAETDVAIMETREAPPAHLLIKIQSFSLLEKHGIKKFETTKFESGGYKWKLIIYPHGRDGEEGYVSVYLAIVDYGGLPAGWEVNAVFTIFLFNQISGNYRYSPGRSRSFGAIKTEWGFSKFISTKELKDQQNGYLSHDDNCVFGVEVFVNRKKPIIDCMSLKSVVGAPYKREWKIPKFSKLASEWVSPEFSVGDHKWCMKMYRNGYGEASGRFLSLYLHYIPTNGNNERLHTSLTIRMKNHLCSKHETKAALVWYSTGSLNWGWPSFIDLAVVNDHINGFIKKDCCIIEVEIYVQAIASSG